MGSPIRAHRRRHSGAARPVGPSLLAGCGSFRRRATTPNRPRTFSIDRSRTPRRAASACGSRATLELIANEGQCQLMSQPPSRASSGAASPMNSIGGWCCDLRPIPRTLEPRAPTAGTTTTHRYGRTARAVSDVNTSARELSTAWQRAMAKAAELEAKMRTQETGHRLDMTFGELATHYLDPSRQDRRGARPARVTLVARRRWQWLVRYRRACRPNLQATTATQTSQAPRDVGPSLARRRSRGHRPRT